MDTTFRYLHQRNDPFILCNVWDAHSAKVAQSLGFDAVGTSSAAIASVLGYEDGEDMPFDDVLFMVNRISKVTTLPLTVDIESGYSRNPLKVFNYIKHLHELGVVGVNIEDSIVAGSRQLLPVEEFALFLTQVKALLIEHDIDVFLNVRIDTYLLEVPKTQENTFERVLAYQSAGADGVFVPCISNPQDIDRLVKMTLLPVNVMCVPNLPDFDALKLLGIKRISMGNVFHTSMMRNLVSSLKSVKHDKSFKKVFV